MKVRLIDLDPRWVGAGGEGIYNADGTPAEERHGVGLSFLCPCEACKAKRTGNPDEDFHLRHFVAFANPLDGKPPLHDERHRWQRVGDAFDVLSLTPSILSDRAKGGCGWHGFVGSNGAAPGEVITV